MLTVPYASPDFPGGFYLFSDDDGVDLSGTVVTYRLWVESEVPGATLRFWATNEYIARSGIPVRYLEVPAPSEPTEIRFDLACDGIDEPVSVNEGAGGAGGASGQDLVYFDPSKLLGLGLFVFGGDPPPGTEDSQVTIYLDEIAFSRGPVENMTFDTGPAPVEAYRQFDGSPTELSWQE